MRPGTTYHLYHHQRVRSTSSPSTPRGCAAPDVLDRVRSTTRRGSSPVTIFCSRHRRMMLGVFFFATGPAESSVGLGTRPRLHPREVCCSRHRHRRRVSLFITRRLEVDLLLLQEVSPRRFREWSRRPFFSSPRARQRELRPKDLGVPEYVDWQPLVELGESFPTRYFSSKSDSWSSSEFGADPVRHAAVVIVICPIEGRL